MAENIPGAHYPLATTGDVFYGTSNSLVVTPYGLSSLYNVPNGLPRLDSSGFLPYINEAPVQLCKNDGIVLGYGYGSGSNTDRGNALLAAVNAAISGDVIFLGHGTFAHTGNLSTTKLLTIRGSTNINTVISGSININNFRFENVRLLGSATGSTIPLFNRLDVSLGVCYDLNDFESFDWINRVALNNSEQVVFDWNNQRLMDLNESSSIDWEQRLLKDGGNNTVLNYSSITGARASLGLVIGTNVQAYDAQLAAVAALSPTGNQLIKWTGSGPDGAQLIPFSTFGQSVVSGDAATASGLLGLSAPTPIDSGVFQSSNVNLTGIANLSPTGNQFIYYTGSGPNGAVLATITQFGRSLASGTDAQNVKGTLGFSGVFSHITVPNLSSIIPTGQNESLQIIAGTGIYLNTSGNRTLTIHATGGGSASTAFTNVAVTGQNNLVANNATGTITFVGGTGIYLVTNSGDDSLTIAVTGIITSGNKISELPLIASVSGNYLMPVVMNSGGTLVTCQIPVSGFRRETHRTLFDYYTDSGNITTNESVICSGVIRSGVLPLNGDKIYGYFSQNLIGSATATSQVKIYFPTGNLILDTGPQSLTFDSTWQSEINIVRVSSTGIRVSACLQTPGASLAVYSSGSTFNGLSFNSGNAIRVTATRAGVGAATNDIVLKHGYIEFIGAAL